MFTLLVHTPQYAPSQYHTSHTQLAKMSFDETLIFDLITAGVYFYFYNNVAGCFQARRPASIVNDRNK